MIAADTSAWVGFFKDQPSAAARKLEACLADQLVVLPMHVLFELLSGPGLTAKAASLVARIPRLELRDGFWERAAKMRRMVLARRLRARSIDCLIAQNCIDHETSLIADDGDYRHFVRYGLELA